MASPSKGFTRLAPIYDLLLRLTSGNAIPGSQTALLKFLPKSKHALIIGGGTGTFLLEVLKMNLAEQITYLDISEGMIIESRKKVHAQFPEISPHIHFICGTIDQLSPEQHFDLIFTHYFLDLFEEKELETLLIQLYIRLHSQGLWHISDFAPASSSSMLYESIHSLLYAFFRSLCGISGQRIPDLKTKLQQQCMTLVEEKYFLNGFLWSGIWKKIDRTSLIPSSPVQN